MEQGSLQASWALEGDGSSAKSPSVELLALEPQDQDFVGSSTGSTQSPTLIPTNTDNYDIHSHLGTTTTPTSNSHINPSAYKNLTSIDWRYELAQERRHNSHSLNTQEHTSATRSLLRSVYSSSQTWIILVLTGILVGVAAAFIDIVSQWLGDLRTGYCTQGFYLNKQSCCWSITTGTTTTTQFSTGTMTGTADQCEEWKSWPELVHLKNHSFFASFLAYFIFVVLSASFAFLAAYLVSAFNASYTKRSGIAEIRTILAGLVIKGFFSLKTLVIKILGLCLVVGSGLYVGKEGPLVHVACCCASLVMSQLSRTGYFSYGESKKRDLFNAASASGISVAFGAPIGGVLFVLEQMVYFANEKSMWHSFVCAMVAAVTLQWFNPFRTGKLVLFQVVYDRIWHRFELGAFLFIGVLGGLYGASIIKLNRKFVQLRTTNKWLKAHPILETVCTAVITAVIAYPNIYTRQQTSTLLSYLLEECPSVDGSASNSFDVVASLCNTDRWFVTMLNLLVSCVITVIFTGYSFGLAVPAGILMPSMLIGALGGRAVGLMMHTWHAHYPDFVLFSACPPEGICITPGVYALVGAAASFTGITRLTVSSVVIMFELTGALTYVLPIMTGVIISKWVADSFGRKGIYESLISDQHFPYLERAETSVPIPEVPATDIMTPVSEVTVLYTRGETYGSLKQALLDNPAAQFAVVKNITEPNQGDDGNSTVKLSGFNDPNPILVGCISRQLLTKVVSDYSTLPDIQDSNACIFEPGFVDSMSPDPHTLDLSSSVDRCPPVVTAQSSVLLAINLFQSMGYAAIFVTYKGRLHGVISLTDVCEYVAQLESSSSFTRPEYSIANERNGHHVGDGDDSSLRNGEDDDDDDDDDDGYVQASLLRN